MMHGHQPSKEVLASWAIQQKEFEHMLRANPLVYAGIFGLGITDYVIRALRLRVEHPHVLVFPQKYLEMLLKMLPVPVVWFGDDPVHWPSPDSVALFYDLQGLYHLWALALQWTRGQRQGLVCGNCYFGSPCCGPLCSEGRCPKWSPGASKPLEEGTFTDILRYFRLWKE
jgi:hypothetical protein